MPAFFLHFTDAHISHFAGRLQVRPAAGLEIDIGDFQEAYFASPARWLHGHCAYQFRLRGKFLIRDPAATDGVVGINQIFHRSGDLFFIHAFFHIEVETALEGGNIPAGDAIFKHRPEQMQRRVHAHVAEAQIPVDFRRNRCASSRQGVAFRDNMLNCSVITVSGVHDTRVAAGPGDVTAVARLATAQRIEDAAVKDDVAVAGRRHGRVALLQIRVFAKQ